MLKEFPAKWWDDGLKSLVRRIDSIGGVEHNVGSRRPRSARNALIEYFVL